MKRYLFALAIVFLSVFVCVGGVFLYRYANTNLSQDSLQEFEQVQIKEANESKSADSWVNELADLTPKEYILATNEIFIEFKDRQNKRSASVYQLVIDKNDIYSMFCLSQTLKNNSVDFSVVKENSLNLIYINTQDKKILNSVISELKAYGIDSHIREVKL